MLGLQQLFIYIHNLDVNAGGIFDKFTDDMRICGVDGEGDFLRLQVCVENLIRYTEQWQIIKN